MAITRCDYLQLRPRTEIVSNPVVKINQSELLPSRQDEELESLDDMASFRWRPLRREYRRCASSLGQEVLEHFAGARALRVFAPMV
ncbi:hypothetical protein CQ042_00040 [Microbacterium sp. MYb62]|nr:hypothetical protein CQ042_00040 [Microbacterium sp. MYb62]